MNLISKEQIIAESGKSQEFIKAAFHEAGHALVAFQVGWNIESILVNPASSIFKTSYDFGEDLSLVVLLDKLDNIACDDKFKDIIIRRAKVALAGGICEEIYADKYEINYDDNTSDCDYDLIAHLNVYLKRNCNYDMKFHMEELRDLILEKWNFIDGIVVSLIKADGYLDYKSFNEIMKH